MKRMKRYILFVLTCLLGASCCFAQSERSSVRRGNRDFRKEHWPQAEIDYKKALVADSTSVTADYNLANTYFRLENYPEADRYYKAGLDSLAKGKHGADAFHNAGNAKLKQRSWQEAIDFYKQSLRRNPGDMETKANLAYAQKMLENEQQDGGGGGNNDQNQDQQQNQDQNKDQNQDQNQNDDQNKDQDQNQDQNQNQNQDQNNDQNQDQQQQQQQDQGQQPKITPQAAQQMLQAIQAQEKDTQDKVKKEKAARLKSKQKEKNW